MRIYDHFLSHPDVPHVGLTGVRYVPCGGCERRLPSDWDVTVGTTRGPVRMWPVNAMSMVQAYEHGEYRVAVRITWAGTEGVAGAWYCPPYGLGQLPRWGFIVDSGGDRVTLHAGLWSAAVAARLRQTWLYACAQRESTQAHMTQCGMV